MHASAAMAMTVSSSSICGPPSPAKNRGARPLVEVAEVGASSHLRDLALDLLDDGAEAWILAKPGQQRIAAEERRVLPSGPDTGLQRVERLAAPVLHQEENRVLHRRVEAGIA